MHGTPFVIEKIPACSGARAGRETIRNNVKILLILTMQSLLSGFVMLFLFLDIPN